MYFITKFIFEKKRNMRFFVLLWLGLLFNSCHTQSSNNINSSTEELVNESNVDTVYTLADFFGVPIFFLLPVGYVDIFYFQSNPISTHLLE